MELEEKILSLSMEYSAVLITAPRQIGGITILRQIMQETRTYVTLDDLEKRAMAQKDPVLFKVQRLPCSVRQFVSLFRNNFQYKAQKFNKFFRITSKNY